MKNRHTSIFHFTGTLTYLPLLNLAWLSGKKLSYHWPFWIKCGGPAPTTSGSEEDGGGTTSSPGTPTGEKDLEPQEELVITNGKAIEEISFLQVPNDK